MQDQSSSWRITPTDVERIVPFEVLLDRVAEERASAWVRDRRHLHANPELSGQEKRTTQFIADRLRTFGMTPLITDREVGAVADMVIGNPPPDAPLIAIRADIDALPLQDRKGAEYSSTCSGIAHSCGHDAHTTIALAVAETVHELTRRLPESEVPGVRLRWIFQPAEETAEGAAWMVEAGALEGVRCILGMHVDPTISAGKVGIRYGVLTAHLDEVSILVRGKGGHAARPHHTTDPMATAASLVTTLYQTVPRRVDSLTPTVFTIGSIHGGNVSNVIPDQINLEGTLRTTDRKARQDAMDAIRRVCDGLAVATECCIDVEFKCPLGSVVNDVMSMSAYEAAAIQVLGGENLVLIDKPSMGGEDFAVYLDHVPGAQFRLGCAGVAGEWPLLHSPVFDIDERAIAIGARIVTRAALILALMNPAAT